MQRSVQETTENTGQEEQGAAQEEVEREVCMERLQESIKDVKSTYMNKKRVSV